MRSRALFSLLIVSMLSSRLAGAPCNSACPHGYSKGARFAFSELINITNINIPGDVQWHDIMTPCVTNNGELHANTAFNAVIRLQFAVTGVTAPVGSNFETRISVYRNTTLVTQSTYTRKIRRVNTPFKPEGEWFNSIVQGLAANTNYDIYVRVRLLAAGSITVSNIYVSAQGSPTSYGSGTVVNSNVQAVGPTTWVKIAEAPFMNSSTENVDLSMQSYVQFVGGTTGQKLLLGMTVDGLSSGNHNQTLYVPASFPDGVNSFDHLPNPGLNATVTPGSHNVQLWAKNGSGGTTTLQYCQVQAIGFPLSNGLTRYADNAGPVAGRSDWSPAVQPQPHVCLMLDRPIFPDSRSCDTTGMTAPLNGTWTKLGEITFPSQSSSTGGYNWIGDGYVELLGQTSAWNSTWCQIAVENRATEPIEKSAENGEVSLSILPVSSDGHYFMDARRWGAGYGNKLVFWIRKIANYPGTDHGTFQIGRSYFGARAIDPGLSQCEQ